MPYNNGIVVIPLDKRTLGREFDSRQVHQKHINHWVLQSA